MFFKFVFITSNRPFVFDDSSYMLLQEFINSGKRKTAGEIYLNQSHGSNVLNDYF